jgi:hypothetical protein
MSKPSGLARRHLALAAALATATAAAPSAGPAAAASQPLIPPAGGEMASATGLAKPSAVGDRSPYQNMVTSKCGTADCIVPLVKVPPKWHLELHNVSCFSIMDSNTGFYWFGVRNNRASGSISCDYVTPTKMVYVTGANYSYWSVNTQMLSYAVSGDTLSVQGRGNGVLQSLQCKVAGDWVYTG